MSPAGSGGVSTFLAYLRSGPGVRKLPVKPRTLGDGPCKCEGETQWIGEGLLTCLNCGLRAREHQLKGLRRE